MTTKEFQQYYEATKLDRMEALKARQIVWRGQEFLPIIPMCEGELTHLTKQELVELYGLALADLGILERGIERVAVDAIAISVRQELDRRGEDVEQLLDDVHCDVHTQARKYHRSRHTGLLDS
jgi:hypothetical protein